MGQMNKNFEPVILETYAELCVRWRMAHVEGRVQADDYDAQLKSLESVISAFGLNLPGGGGTRSKDSKGAAQSPQKGSSTPSAGTRGGVVLGD